MKQIALALIVVIAGISSAQAAWVNTQTTAIVTDVRTYQQGTDGLRAQITVSGATHDCGTEPSTFFFDSVKTTLDVVKAVMSLAFGAMVAGKQVIITYDCTLSTGGYGWGTALRVTN